MTYPETIQYLESFINYEKIPFYPYEESLQLERIKGFLKAIDNPQDCLKCIHIAGTKGKGSTSAFIAYILKEAGYRVGLYTSPHLADFRERIRILDSRSQDNSQSLDFEGMISREELAELVEELKPAIEKYSQSSQYGNFSFFEVYTALALYYFKKQKIDFAVLETGLGGRLDATNTVNSYISIITPISYEHTKQLGASLNEIAGEKAGIIKNQDSIVITAPQEQEAMEVIKNRCREVGARLYKVGKDILYEKTKTGFSVLSIFGEYIDLKIRLIGAHQLINASLAIGSLDALRFYDIYIDVECARRGLYNTIWPGRCEVVSKEPLVVLDGAQNVASVLVLKEAIQKNFTYRRLILVFGVSQDKDIKGMCRELYGFADEFILTKSDNPRASKPEALAEYLKEKKVHLTKNIKEAKALAFNLADKEDLILVAGSLFVAGEMRTLLNKGELQAV